MSFYIGICHKPASKGINIDLELNFCFGHNREWNLEAGLFEPIRILQVANTCYQGYHS